MNFSDQATQISMKNRIDHPSSKITIQKHTSSEEQKTQNRIRSDLSTELQCALVQNSTRPNCEGGHRPIWMGRSRCVCVSAPRSSSFEAFAFITRPVGSAPDHFCFLLPFREYGPLLRGRTFSKVFGDVEGRF